MPQTSRNILSQMEYVELRAPPESNFKHKSESSVSECSQNLAQHFSSDCHCPAIT